LPAPTPGKRNTRSKVADPEAPATGNRRRTRSVAEQEETAAGPKIRRNQRLRMLR